ncbi:DinB family protein [Antrihabitans cavernicola]|uniref:DinB family protein n=1 Tax=Antrihabitans cavernicola TaxID=2495913 RepID=A0A5A7SEC2_9NOCA|nr:DinB family protein [Spelaeibacter cavernicola]KAA0022571.1 DinB family protein [Spelaeibacter cavernicola]
MTLYTPTTLTVDVTGEKLDLLTVLADQRNLLRLTVLRVTDEQARQRTTVSELTLGGLIKHVAQAERASISRIVERDENAVVDMNAIADAYTMGEQDTMADLLVEYQKVAAETEKAVAELGSLDDSIPLPTAPWAPKREWCSARRLVLHVIRETAHHCGHADIIRESLDGATTMGALWQPEG